MAAKRLNKSAFHSGKNSENWPVRQVISIITTTTKKTTTIFSVNQMRKFEGLALENNHSENGTRCFEEMRRVSDEGVHERNMITIYLSFIGTRLRRH